MPSPCYRPPSMKDTELVELVRLAGDGSREATEALIEAYMDRVRDHVSRRVGPKLRQRLETEDILQSSLALAVRDLEGKDLDFEGERPFLAWLYKITERKIQMAARHHGAGKRAIDKQQGLDEPERRPAANTSPSQLAVRNERAERVREALADLADDERQLIEMRILQGITFKEMAARLSATTEDAVRQRYVRLLARVGPRLQEVLKS